MLKFERSGYGREITLAVRDKNSRLSRSLLVAFAYALLLHLLFLLLFQVAPLTIKDYGPILKPFQAEAAVATLDKAAEAALELSMPFYSGLPAFKRPLPELPEQPEIFLTSFLLPSLLSAEKQTNPFTSIEKEIYEPAFSSHVKKHPPPIQIFISGALASIPLSNPAKPPVPPISAEERAVFTVLVETKSGSIFWYEPVQTTGDPQLDHFAEALLHQLRFHTRPSTSFIAGQVEIHFTASDAL